jgi:GAF domain-containing protein
MSSTSSGAPSGGFANLSSWRVTDDENLRDGLRKVAEAGCALLANCLTASVTIIERGRASTAAYTDERAEELDTIQYDADDGPCLAAVREQRLIRIDDMTSDDRWPIFADAAAQRGVLSSLSIPLVLAGDARAGGLNIYGQPAAAFSADDEQLATAFATQASVVVSNAQAYWAAFEMTQNLTRAMESRAVIEQAKGVLIARHGLGDDDAFDMLRNRSQTENRKLRDIANELVEQARQLAVQNDGAHDE